MLIDLVLAVDGQYWRSSRDLSVVPGTGTVLRVLDDIDLEATVSGSTYRLAGYQDRSAAPAVLIRASTTSPRAVGVALRRAGWHQLM